MSYEHFERKGNKKILFKWSCMNLFHVLSCREQLVSQVEQLKAKLTENHQSLQSSTIELQQLQVEHDTLLERHNKILQETISKEAELRERHVSFTVTNLSK